MYKLYTIFYAATLLIYLVLYNTKSTIGCICNDILFYFNLTLYVLIVSMYFKDKKTMFILLGVSFILIRFVLIEYFCKFFSDYFGFSAIEYDSDRLFYKLIDNNDNYLTKIYSKYGAAINEIKFDARGLHDNTKNPNYKPNRFLKIFFDFLPLNKKNNVVKYFTDILDISINEDVEKVIKLLDEKYLISKYIWNIILITILFSLSLKYI